MNIKQYLTKVNFAKSKTKKNQYIVIHYTANNGDTAMNNAKYFNEIYRGASAHYFVDEREVVRVVSDCDVAWHCGTKGKYKHPKCRNSNSIGIELCSRINCAGEYYIKSDVVELTELLVADLMKKYKIPLENVIRHFDVTGKNCPRPMVENNKIWVDFKENVKEILTMKKVYKKLCDVPDWAKPTIGKLVERGALNGDENGNLNLSDDMVRIFVVNDRMGIYER